ncbi:ATP-binding protein [Actinomadura viridis]|uniref:Anti-sigma regulatory factor (Ser/Thr protein kinase) n=1 Tax=Actinomadura viridis TaxID=58110 RepID=A0A931DRQ2_9ACTN|nr:ATP-binding protein [Actinomadura viridis]MBG6093534.1 anti-sigma regulatory factor (Ser/Thr protein kinase) [Actinomadura viridis]
MKQRVAGAGGVDVRAVRSMVRDLLAKESPEVDTADADVITAEIATNARRYSASGRCGGGVWVVVLRAAGRTRVEIQDDGDAVTVPMISDEADESGRGLLIVDSLAAAWGYRVGQDGDRKVTVWFEMSGAAAG